MAKATIISACAVMSHQEVADKLFEVTGKRLSRARIQQIERAALAKIKAAAEQLGLREELAP